jgi:hypothetical protein
MQGEPNKILLEVEKLLNIGNYDEALHTVKIFESGGKFEPQARIDAKFLKSNILTKQSAYAEALQLAKGACKESKDQGLSLQVVVSYIAMANILEYLGEFNEKPRYFT